MGDYLVISPDGHTTWLDVPTPLVYDQFVAIVGGHIEVIYPFGFEAQFPRAWGWEEARIFNAGVNPIVTKMAASTYGYTMIGTFLFFADDEDNNSIPLPDTDMTWLKQWIRALGYPVPEAPVDYATAIEEINAHRRD